MGIPCFLGGMARGMLGRNSYLHIRQKRRDALKEADLVILAGNDGKWIVLLYNYNQVIPIKNLTNRIHSLHFIAVLKFGLET